MCGIAGFFDFKYKSDKKILTLMSDALLHRGPDDSGYEVWENNEYVIGFGHRRLSIIDLSPLGHQPMSYANDRYHIVFNGEIYNYKEIQNELLELGYKFKSNSDTEVVLAAFDKWGVEAVHKFVGMFAFALFDCKEQTVKIFRDRAGVKPLYYYWKDDLFLFSSELKSFHQHPNFKKEISSDALTLYFKYGYIPAPNSIFKNTFKLLPGHFISFHLKTKTLTEIKYWDVNDYYAKQTLKIDEQDAIVETEKILKSACEYRMVADVPVGVFLSGGYDSSLVAAILQKNRTEKLKTFTIGFHENGFNEATYAKQVASHLGTEHTEYFCTQKEAQEIIPSLPFYYDEPFADSSAIPTMLVSKLAKQQVTVALSADAGDETFAGYNKYSHLISILSKAKYIPPFAVNLIEKIDPKKIPYFKNKYHFEFRLKKTIEILKSKSINNANKIISSHFTILEIEKILNTSKKEMYSFFDDTLSQINKNDLEKLLALDYKTYMVDDILTKVDRATMSVSLEGREPLLDHRIIEFAAQLPSYLKFNKGNKKYILKQITHKYLPISLMDRSKMGFGVPIIHWFQSDLKELIESYCSFEFIKNQGILNYKEVENIISDYHKSADKNINKLWILLMFQMWWKRWN